MLRPKLVLASASPRRLALLEQAGITPEALRPATIDESVTKGEVPRHIVRRLARAKAEAARRLVRAEPEFEKAFVLAADTVVAVGRRVLGKAELEHEAGDALRMLRGRAHRVHTAICLLTPDDKWRERVVETRVRFRNLSDEEIGAYLASGEWRGKAGGYAIQGIAGAFVVKLIGSYTNVVGLPLTETVSHAPGRGLSGELSVAVQEPRSRPSERQRGRPRADARCARSARPSRRAKRARAARSAASRVIARLPSVLLEALRRHRSRPLARRTLRRAGRTGRRRASGGGRRRIAVAGAANSAA